MEQSEIVMSELKPCSLCGGNAKYDTGIKFWDTGSWWQVVCEKCHAASFPADTQEEAAMDWNSIGERHAKP